MTEALRTPDERFADLLDCPFESHYAEVPDQTAGTLRVHYLDGGDPTATPAPLLRGAPSWNYLCRHKVPPLVTAGNRVLVLNQVAFGHSHEPTRAPRHRDDGKAIPTT